VLDGRRLDQGQCLEQLIQGPVPTRANDEGAGVAHEHHLAREEVAKAEAEVDVFVQTLLVRQLDVAADRQHAGVAGAAVGRFHQASTPSRDDRVARPAQFSRHLPDQPVVRMLRRRPGRPKYGHRRPNPPEAAEPHGEFSTDRADPLGVSGPRLGWLVPEPLEQLLVEGGPRRAGGRQIPLH